MAERLFNVRFGPGASIRLDLSDGFHELARTLNATSLEEIRVALETGAFKGATRLRDTIRRMYREGRPEHQKLHPFTIKQKGHGQPLFEHGKLAAAVNVFITPVHEDRTDFSVGVLDGTEAIKAQVHEGGATIRVTPKMRTYLRNRGLKLKKSTRFITIPPRPVFLPALQEAMPGISDDIHQQLKQTLLGKKFGAKKPQVRK